MTRPSSIGVLLVVLASFPGSQSVAQPLAPLGLLRVHSAYQQYAHAATYYDQDFFVSRDRVTTGVFSGVSSSNPFTRWRMSRLSTVAPLSAYQALQRAFTENHIGLQDGTCAILETTGPVAGNFEVSWYSTTGTRFSRFSIVFGSPTDPPCNSEQVLLYKAIQTFARATGASLGPGLKDP